MEFKGTYTALVTPFRNGAVDLDAYRRLLDQQRDAGITGVVPCGCTGEAATLSHGERMTLLEVTLAHVGEDMQVIAGTGTNSTAATVGLTQEAEAAGVAAAMLITPYYNKPSQAGLEAHYKRVAESTTLPLVLYNVPGRTGVSMAPETIAALHATGRYPAIKEAGGSIEAVSNIRAASQITVLSGDDSMTLVMIALGAQGVISVVSNAYPVAVRELVDAALEGDIKAARERHFKLLPVMRAAFFETNPSPVKAMLARQGTIAEEVRLPLSVVTDANRARVGEVMQRYEATSGS